MIKTLPYSGNFSSEEASIDQQETPNFDYNYFVDPMSTKPSKICTNPIRISGYKLRYIQLSHTDTCTIEAYSSIN